MRVHLINPSEVSFGNAVFTPRWLYVLASACHNSKSPPPGAPQPVWSRTPQGLVSECERNWRDPCTSLQAEECYVLKIHLREPSRLREYESSRGSAW